MSPKQVCQWSLGDRNSAMIGPRRSGLQGGTASPSHHQEEPQFAIRLKLFRICSLSFSCGYLVLILQIGLLSPMEEKQEFASVCSYKLCS